MRIHRELTPIAAVGLACIMTGATVITIEGGAAAGALVPFMVGILATAIAFGRSAWASPTLAFRRRSA